MDYFRLGRATAAAQRFSAVIIDEYEKVPVGRGGTGLLQPPVEEMAMVVWQLAELSDGRGEWRQRLVLSSAAIERASVEDFFGVEVGFVNVSARQYSLSRYVVASMNQDNLLQVCANSG